MLARRRTRLRHCVADGSNRVCLMSFGKTGCSGRAPSSDEVAPTRGLVATSGELYSAVDAGMRRVCGPPGAQPCLWPRPLLWRLVRTRRAVPLLVLATALPRLLALLHERGAILADFTDKGDNFAQTFLATATYGFIPGHPSAYTQPLYGWFLVPFYWIFGRHWEVVGLAQICISVAT